MVNYIEKMEERARQEEDLFTRAPLTKADKKTMKHIKKARNGYVLKKLIFVYSLSVVY